MVVIMMITTQCALDWSHQSRLCEQELLIYPDASFHLLLLLKGALFLRSPSSSSSSFSKLCFGFSVPFSYFACHQMVNSRHRPHHPRLLLILNSFQAEFSTVLVMSKLKQKHLEVITSSQIYCQNHFHFLSVLVLPIFYGNKAVTDQFTRCLCTS